MIGLLTNRITLTAGAALAGVAVVWGAYHLGQREARQEARERALINDAKTTERINAEDLDFNDPAAVRQRLCDLANLDPCPVPGDGD